MKVISDPGTYFKYLADPEHGIVKEKTVAGIRYRLKYLPKDYLIYKSMENRGDDLRLKDSLLHVYDYSLTFILNIGPAEGETFDITRKGTENYGEFAERIEKMAFEAGEWVHMSIQNKEYKPTIMRMENLNAPEKSRNFIIVFSPEEKAEELFVKGDLCFTYEDHLFNTGINKFIFESEDLLKIPEFRFNKEAHL